MMPAMRATLVAAALLAASVSGCGKSEEGTSNNSPAPVPRVTIGAAGGAVRSGEARIEFPAGALQGDETFGLRQDGDSWVVETERARFAKPVSVTLPVRLPFGNDAVHVDVLLTMGGVTERLRGAVVDRAAGTVTIALDRLFPVAHYDGPAAAPASPFPSLMANVDPGLREGIPMKDGVEWMWMKDKAAKAKTLMPGVEAAIRKARREFGALKLPFPAEVYVGFRPLEKATTAAQASSGNQIEVNTESAYLENPSSLESSIVHECVHLVQHQMCLANLRALKIEPRLEELNPEVNRWVDEGTAEFLSARLCSDHEARLVSRLHADFGRKSARRWNEDDAHEYQMGVFFCWLDTLYDGVELFRELYTVHRSAAFVTNSVQSDREGRRGSWDLLNVLDFVLKKTPDRKGRTRNLKEVYVDFLLRLLWRKDFEPVSSNRGIVEPLFGPPGEIALPPEAERLNWALPAADGAVRQAATVSGDSWQIVKVIQIASRAAEAKQTGDLIVSVHPQGQTPKDSVVLIVFPRRKALQEPEIGAPGKPVVIPAWEECTAATVWVVDVSPYGNGNLEITAEFGAAGQKSEIPALELKLTSVVDANRPCEAEASFSVLPTREMTADERARSMAAAGLDSEKRSWIRFEVTVGGRRSFLYGRFTESPASIGGHGSGVVWAPLKAGKYDVTARTSVRGKELACKGSVTIKQNTWIEKPAELLAKKKEVVARLEKELEEAKRDKNAYRVEDLNYELVYLKMEICDVQLNLGDLEGARAAASEGLAFADEDRKLVCNRYIAKCCLYAGDAEGAWTLYKAQGPGLALGPGGMAEYYVRFNDDRATAWSLLEQEEKQSGRKQEPGYPRANEDVLK
jgi:hypothetical protein